MNSVPFFGWAGATVATCLVASIVACSPSDRSMGPMINEMMELYQEETNLLESIKGTSDAETAVSKIHQINRKLRKLGIEFENKEKEGIYFYEQLELFGLRDQWFALIDQHDTAIQRLQLKNLMTPELEIALSGTKRS